MNTISMIKQIIRKDYVNDYMHARKRILTLTQSNRIVDRILLYYWNNRVYRINRDNNCSLAVTHYGINETCSFPHGFSGIFVSSGAKIGKQVIIYQQVTIGSNTIKDSKSRGVPVIGDNCIIGAGAKIIGGVKVGANVRIGANCVVVKDVPDYATVVCGENRIILHDKARSNERGSWKDYIGE